MEPTTATRTETICAICETPLRVRWSDSHGVAACLTCGLPYRLYHYEGETRVEKPPSVEIDSAWLPLAREYWHENHRRVFPGACDLGFLRGRDVTYSGATREDNRLFDAWMERHKERWPKSIDEA